MEIKSSVLDEILKLLLLIVDILTGNKTPLSTPWERLIKAVAKSDISTAQKVGMMAQAILESGRGTSDLALNHFNFHGLKYRKELEGIATPVGYEAHDGLDTYAKFESPESSVKGYLAFIKRSPYRGWTNHLSSPSDYVSFLKECGYAESPDYVAKLEALFPEAYRLLGIDLKEVERPDSPPDDEGFSEVWEPKFVRVSGVNFKSYKYGTKSGKAEGLVVHYTVSGRSASSAVNVLKYLAKMNYGCMVMDEDGVIYIPENFDIFTDAAAHAGKSAWLGRSGLNDEFMGMEICNWGRSSSNDASHGRTRYSKEKANIIEGWYQPYTEKQELELLNFCRWAKLKNKFFQFENVCGHDEVRAAAGHKGGKQDPGASLSMTMPELRYLLLK